MKVVFLSNFLNHHQVPFSNNMYDALGDGYKFVQTEPVNEERLNMGYEDMEGKYPYILCPYKSEEESENTKRLVDEADFVITGSAPEFYIKNRLDNNKPVFRFSERFMRHQKWRFFTPKSLKFMYNRHTKYRKNNVFVLCASAYTAIDYAFFGAYKNKTFKWGYFPEVIEHDIDKLIENKQDKVIELLWVARFLKLKHPEKFLKVLKRLKDDGYNFKAKIIGSGECEAQMREFVKTNKLESKVKFLGTMSPDKVREHMESANIFMFNSDYREGWGAVVNEAMNSGCAVISSHAPGAVPFLIKHKISGLIYNDKNFEDLYKNTKLLVEDRNLCALLGKNAYYTLKQTWNAKTAAENLIKLFSSFNNGVNADIKDGPCSIAKRIFQWKMYKTCIKGEKI
jgi:glycosyltransferase involved in cell wall biosynthesis